MIVLDFSFRRMRVFFIGKYGSILIHSAVSTWIVFSSMKKENRLKWKGGIFRGFEGEDSLH